MEVLSLLASIQLKFSVDVRFVETLNDFQIPNRPSFARIKVKIRAPFLKKISDDISNLNIFSKFIKTDYVW